MAKKKKQYYSISKIEKMECRYNLLLGGRNIGKSYAVKRKLVTEAWKNSLNKFIYLRRYDSDINESLVTSYFGDVDIVSITDGQANVIEVFRKQIFASFYDENTGKKTKIKQIGYACALNLQTRYKSTTWLDVQNIVYEEFVTDEGYLFGEVNKLKNFVSTVARDRAIQVWLIGNTISRVCPYYNEWKLTRIPKQEAGTIDVYNFEGVTIGVELIDKEGGGQMFFGENDRMIKGVSWEVKSIPRLPKGEDYKQIFFMVIMSTGFKFTARLLYSKYTGYIWLITPKTTSIKPKTRVISDTPNANYYFTVGFKPLNELEQTIFKLFDESHVFFSDELCASDFKNIYKYIKYPQF